MKLISQKHAINSMIGLLSVVLVFHILILIKIIPYDIVWAGKISSLEQMRKLEVVSILVNSFSIIILMLKVGYIKNKIPKNIFNVIIWLLVILFGLNTIGNLFAVSRFEVYFFTPLTFVSTILCLRIVLNKR